jgi:hypothetical protein
VRKLSEPGGFGLICGFREEFSYSFHRLFIYLLTDYPQTYPLSVIEQIPDLI